MIALGVSLFLVLPPPARATMPPLSGRVPDALAQAYHDRLFHAPPKAVGMHTEIAGGTWRIPVILVSFADDTVRYTASDFDRLLFDTTRVNPNGSVAEYWSWASRGRIQLTGRVVASVALPETAGYYAAGTGGTTGVLTPRNAAGYVQDALRLGQASVDWTEFDTGFDGFVDMVWLVHAGVGAEGGNPGRLLSLTSQLSVGWNNSTFYPTSTLVPGTLNRPIMIDRFTVLPEQSLFKPDSLVEIGVFCHEFGHALDLPDLYDINDSRNVGPGCWSLMSSGAYGGDHHTPEIPVHPGAYAIRLLEWDHTFRPTRDTTLSLAPLERTTDQVQVWYQGENTSEYYLLENRRRIDYDRNLPGEGLVLYHVGGSGLELVEGDGDGDLRFGRNRGDANDPLPGALGITRLDDSTVPSLESYDGQLTNIALEDIALDGMDTRVRVRVRALGWQLPVDWTGAGFNPVSWREPAHAAGLDRSGIEYVVVSEFLSGRPQVVLRTSEAWDQPITLSHSTAGALDPSLAILPSGDLGVVWSDTRRGRAEIYYRARILGEWTAERPLVSLSGSCRTPSLGCDGRGGMYLAFTYQSADTLQLKFERFNYASGRGQAVVVSDLPVIPAHPTVCVGADGHGYVVWQDRRPGGVIWFASFDPDTLVMTRQPLSLSSQGTATYAATMDSVGGLYVLWNQSSQFDNQLILHSRGGAFGPIPEEDEFESLNLPLETLALEIDPEGSIHVAFALASSNGLTLRYRRKWPEGVWDVASTDLSFPGDDQGRLPILLPHLHGNVDLIYTGVRSQQTQFMVRSRVLASEPLLGAGMGLRALVTPGLWPAPNPVRAGRDLELRGGPLPPGRAQQAAAMVDVFDLSGRKLTTVPVLDGGTRWIARVPGSVTRTWSDGVYFARLRGTDGTARVVVVR